MSKISSFIDKNKNNMQGSTIPEKNMKEIKPFIFSDDDLKELDSISKDFEKINTEQGKLTKGDVISFLYRKPQFPIWGEMDFKTCEIIVYLVQYLVASKKSMYKSSFKTFNEHILTFNDAVDLLQDWINHMIIPQLRIISDFTADGLFPVCYSLDSDTMQGTAWLIEYLKIAAAEDELETLVNTQFEKEGNMTFSEAVSLFEEWFYDLLIP